MTSSDLEATDLGKQKNAISMTCNSHGKQFLVFLLLSDKEIALKCFTLFFDNDENVSLSLLYKIPRTTSSIANIRGTPFIVISRQCLNENLTKNIVPETSKCEESICLYSYVDGRVAVNESIHKKEDIFYFLNQECVSILILDLKSPGDCLVLVGKEGKLVYISCDKNGLVDKTFYVPGPIYCCDNVRNWLFYSNSEGIYKVDLLKQSTVSYTPFDIEFVPFNNIRRLHIDKTTRQLSNIFVRCKNGYTYKLDIDTWGLCEPSDVSSLLKLSKNYQEQHESCLQRLEIQNNIIRNLSLCHNALTRDIKIHYNENDNDNPMSACITVLNPYYINLWFVICCLESLRAEEQICMFKKATKVMKFFCNPKKIAKMKPFKISLKFFLSDPRSDSHSKYLAYFKYCDESVIGDNQEEEI